MTEPTDLEKVEALRRQWDSDDPQPIDWPGRGPVTPEEVRRIAAEVPRAPSGRPWAGQWYVIANVLSGRPSGQAAPVRRT